MNITSPSPDNYFCSKLEKITKRKQFIAQSLGDSNLKCCICWSIICLPPLSWNVKDQLNITTTHLSKSECGAKRPVLCLVLCRVLKSLRPSQIESLLHFEEKRLTSFYTSNYFSILLTLTPHIFLSSKNHNKMSPFKICTKTLNTTY